MRRRRLALARKRRAEEVQDTLACRSCGARTGQACGDADEAPRPLPHPQRFRDWAVQVANGRRRRPQ